MKNKSLEENLSELNEIFKSYLEARVALLKALLLEKVTQIGTYFFSVVLAVVVFASMLLLLTLAFSFWYGNVYGNVYVGFLIMAGFYALTGIILYLLRKPIFSNNIIRNVGKVLFSDHEDEED